MINPVKFFAIYTAIDLHFKGKYDYFKYGPTKVSEASFEKRKDKVWFEKMAKKCADDEMAVGICVSNFISGAKYIINFKLEIYHKWVAYRDAANYKFKEQMNKYKSGLQNKSENAQEILIGMYLSKELTLEFLILLNVYLGNDYLFNKLDGADNFLWQGIKKQVLAYVPFIINLWHIHPETFRKQVA